ncbi:TRM3 tRNA [Candida maltosa Xu316]|uniref:tRNA/rRNA methyltransferase SpoU type domain-containing protein n=1 Tax=Candida maltosa (strain Xu316) TaxID=1245528 RepID=M3IPG2_CANMX|nr:hypothetical protein G210_1101 [Candida maltosa Xu316]
MSSSVLIAKYLGDDKKAELIESLSLEIENNEENVDVLIELLDGFDLPAHPKLYKTILEYCQTKLLDEKYNAIILKFITRIPVLRVEVVKQIIQLLKTYIKNQIYYFNNDICKLITIEESQETQQNVTSEELILILGYLEALFQENYVSNSEIDYILLTFLGIDDSKIGSLTSKMLRWRINSIAKNIDSKLIWDIIFILQKSDSDSHKSLSLVLWLRYLNTGLTESETFQQVIQDENYWMLLQKGLISEAHEYRKFSLSILSLSLESIDTQIDNKYIRWDMKEKSKYFNEWSRFMTLYEIVGIDTSLNQAEAGKNDITGLISPTSLIPASWGWCLLSTGLKAALESVRKFTVRLLLSIPPEHVYLIKHGLPIFESAFLPNIMSASNLNIKVVDGKVECEYAQQLKNYICNMVKNMTTDQEFRDISLSILKVLAELSDSFGPSRILVLHGLLEGLKGKKVLKFGVHDLPLVVLFEAEAEGEILELYHQTLTLRLLSHFEFDFVPFLSNLNKFVKFNGFSLLKDNQELLAECVKNVSVSEIQNNMDVELQALFLGITRENIDGVVKTSSDVLFTKIFESGLKNTVLKPFESRLSELVLSDESEVIHNLSNSEFSIGVPSSEIILQLWNNISEDLQSNQLATLDECLYKFRLFNQVYEKSEFKFKDITTLLDAMKIIMANNDELSKTARFFYKLRDNILGEYYTALKITVERNHTQDINPVLAVLNPSTTNNKANIAMVAILLQYLESTPDADLVYQIAEFLSELWTNLTASRLKLRSLDLHVIIIKAFFHPKIMLHPDVSSMISKFGLSVIENSQVRRSFLPTLTTALSDCQIKHQDVFESLDWLPEILVKAYIVHQPNTNFFVFPEILGEIYDKEISGNEKSNIYAEVYGNEEISARINVMAIFNSIKSNNFAQAIHDYVIDNQAYFHLFKPFKTTDAVEEWTRMQLYSIILSLVEKLDIQLDVFLARLGTEPSPMARSYVEWVIAYKLLENETYVTRLLNELSESINTLRPSIVCSYMKILFLSFQQHDPTKESELLTKLLNSVVPGSTTSRKMIRHFSLSLVVSIHDEIKRKNLPVNSHVLELVDNLYVNTIKSETFSQYRSGDELLWDIVKDLTLVNISGGVMLRLSDRTDLDYIKQQDFHKYISQEQLNILHREIGTNPKKWVGEPIGKSKKPIITPVEPMVQSSPLQTKSGAWNAILDVDIENSRAAEVDRSDLIVVSSLVDKPPNLGGICRLCDVLGAGLLTLDDIEVKNHPHFKTVAVTADQWMPMIEVKLDQIKDYLLQKKREGYTLIGLEQTDKSVELNNDLKFPKKSLILIGREREGIPGDLLAELDFCVEIKQVGIVRSMNIQTATAIIVHAYSSQHC